MPGTNKVGADAAIGRRRWAALLFAAVVSILPATGRAQAVRPPVASQSSHDVMIVNRAPSPIVEVYVSASGDDWWGDDRLGQGQVPPGQAWRLSSPSARDCNFDIRVVYGDGRAEEKRSLDICHNRQIAFDASGAAAPRPGGSVHRVSFENRGRRTIAELYLSESTSDQWGDDVLSHRLPPGALAKFDHQGGCIADLRVVYDNNAAEERRRIDICRNRQVVIKPGWTTSDELAPLDDATAGVRPDHRT